MSENIEDIQCWGMRFSPELVCLKNKEGKKYLALLDELTQKLREVGAFVMEAEDTSKLYIYLMFLSKEECEKFYNEHKDDKVCKDGKLRLIKEPALIPQEMLEMYGVLGKTNNA